MKKTTFYAFLLTIGCATTVLSAPILHAEASASEVAQLKDLSRGFSAVGKKATPAVVSIKVKIESKHKGMSFSPWGSDDQDDGADDPFGQNFWGQFFNFRGQGPSKPQAQTGQASGFIVSSDGYILTNSHVVQDATEITVILNDGREFTGRVVGQDPSTDVAVVKIEASNLPTLTLGNSDTLEAGEWVIAIGSPLELRATLTVGVISATGRNDLSIARIEDFIQTDASINRGNSGGPLLNLDGEVIGINTAIAAGGYSGIGFAIPSNIAKNDLDQIVANGSVARGFLGVTLQKIDKDLAAAFNLDTHEGALVADVAKNTPAEKAGLKQGDVIIKLNSLPVNNVAGLRNAIALMTPGVNAQLTILREGRPIEINVEIGNFPSEIAAKSAPVEDVKLGIAVENLSAEAIQTLGLKEGGVVIKRVENGSIAAWAGLKKGIVILEVNRKKVANVDEYNASLQELSKDKPVLFLIRQGDRVQYLSIKVS